MKTGIVASFYSKNDRRFEIMQKIINILKYLKCLTLYFLALVCSVCAKKTAYKDFWLISERSTDARDNGYHFFKYLRQNYKEINCAYVIDKNSPDYNKVKDLGKTIQPKSFSHYLAFACAKVKISTHIMGYAPDSYRFAILDRKFGIVKGKKVFLQHGIIKDNIAELHYPNVRLDLFICGTIPEYEAILKEFNHPEGVVQCLGLCRYDNLLKEHTVKRRILVMPTWRYYLRKLDADGFRESEYYKNFNGLINDEKLHKLLEENDYELVLYLHYELQKFTELFKGSNPRIKVKGMGNADVQELLMNSALLVTDYSSVYFDFAYMRKPLVYWMFDRELFFSEQYAKGYFSYDDDGFGPVALKKEDVINFIKKELEMDMKVEEKYAQRTSRTFSEFTTDHCERTFNAISKLLN